MERVDHRGAHRLQVWMFVISLPRSAANKGWRDGEGRRRGPVAGGLERLTDLQDGVQVIVRDPHDVHLATVLARELFANEKVERPLTRPDWAAAMATARVFGLDPAGVSAVIVASYHGVRLRLMAGRHCDRPDRC